MVRRRVHVKGIAGLSRGLRTLPKEATIELKDASQELSEELAAHAQDRASGVSPMYRKYVAPTIRARRDRVPTIRIGGRGRIPGRNGRPDSSKQTVGNLIFGAEYGGGQSPRTLQFLPHKGKIGYALWPVIREQFDDMVFRWTAATAEAAYKAAKNGR